MPDYRVYCLDGAGKTIAHAEWVWARDDAEVIAIVTAKRLGVRCELWDGRRLVAELPAHTHA